MTINDLYRQLFGRGGTTKGSDIDMAEHGRVGGVSTGQPFKFVSTIGFTTWVTTAVTLTEANTAYLLPTTEQTDRKVLIVSNVSDTSVYFGGSDVTTSKGIELTAGSMLTIDSASGLYAVCGSSGKTINVLEGK
jgi:hypothetical protein